MPRITTVLTTVLVSAVVAVALSGCSSTPEYDADQACSLDAEAVASLMGSAQFTAESPTMESLPLTASVPGRTSCTVDRDDNRLLIEAMVQGNDQAEANVANARDEPGHFEYRGGDGYVHDDALVWTCGNVTARFSLREAPDPVPDWQALAEPILDQIGCLTYTGPDTSSQPPGWD